MSTRRLPVIVNRQRQAQIEPKLILYGNVEFFGFRIVSFAILIRLISDIVLILNERASISTEECVFYCYSLTIRYSPIPIISQ